MKIRTVEKTMSIWFLFTGIIYLIAGIFTLIALALGYPVFIDAIPEYSIFWWSALVFGSIAVIMGILAIAVSYGAYFYKEHHCHCDHCISEENNHVHTHRHEVIHRREVR